ncbi:MAG TPA: chemotaxis protein CheB, partial [Kofleriaceae bacterium]|nr:chemotaxis protein CheB [Kofleriaceae bacterium]
MAKTSKRRTKQHRTAKRPGRPDPVSGRAPTPAIPPTTSEVFPIVGIGASAGGLEALEQFLMHVPPQSGIAFVVVQHLDPESKGSLIELLQRTTPMPVEQAKDGVRVERDHVYVIPPGKDMSLLHGDLHLLPQVAPHGRNLPIDFFFRSLADDQQERSIGVILSGMGSDGTLGLRAIKEKAGAAFVQSLTSAKFDNMPRSAIDAGLADVVADVEELPARIIAYREHVPYIRQPHVPFEDKVPSALDKIYVLLRAHSGNDFSLYKKTTIHRRIERRMGLHQIDSMSH